MEPVFCAAGTIVIMVIEKLKADAEAQAIQSALTALDNLEKPSAFSSAE